MNWTKLSAAAEFLSSIAILATLVYLAIELQQNSAATQANTRQGMLAADQDFLTTVLENPELDTLYYKSDLTDEERVELSVLLITLTRIRENNWLQYENGVLDEVTWEAYRGSLVGTLSAPQTRIWWQNFGVEQVFDPSFVSVVDELLVGVPVSEGSSHIAAFD